MSSQEYPLKHVRLEQLHKAGFNIADFICFSPGTLLNHKDELRDFLKKHDKISCRHFHDDEKHHFKCPVLYDQTDFDKILEFCLANNYGKNEQKTPFYTLCNEAIKLDDSICAGNILVLNEDTYFIEYFHGPGTPRDIESKAPPELKVYSKSGYSPAEGEKPSSEVMSLLRSARQFKAFENKAYIIEFSVYPYPIGRNQSRVICWEWRWGWLHYQLQTNQYLLKQLQEANVKIAELEEKLNTMRILHITG